MRANRILIVLIFNNIFGFGVIKRFPLNATLNIKIQEQYVYADLEFRNETQSSLLVDKYKLALNGELTTRAFNIMDEDEKQVPYTGLLAKRIDAPENYIEIGVGESISVKVKLNDYYDLSPEPRKYKIQFCAFDPFDGLDGMYEVCSNTVEIAYP